MGIEGKIHIGQIHMLPMRQSWTGLSTQIPEVMSKIAGIFRIVPICCSQMDTESDDRGGGQENEAPPRKKRKTASSDGEKKQNSAGLQRPSKKNKGLSTSRESN